MYTISVGLESSDNSTTHPASFMKNGTDDHDLLASNVLVPAEGYPTDKELVAGVKSGNNRYLELMYQKYDQLVTHIATSILHSHTEVRDAVQEFWTDKVRLLQNFNPAKGCLLAWIKIGIKHYAIDKLRRQRRYQRMLNETRLDSSTLEVIPSGRHQEFYSQFVIREAASLIQKYQHVLPTSQLEVLLLFMQGFSQAEIASQIQVSTSTVKTRYQLGIKKLRPIFERAFQKQYVSPRPKNAVTN